jgi:hypothetical protein
MTAKSLWFSNSALAATDVVEPLTSSPMTRGLEEGNPSATRTTLTSAPCAVSASDSAELNPANPQGVGGYVLRMPKLGVPQNPCCAPGKIDDRGVGTAFKVIPTWGCCRHVRRERLLSNISGEWLTHPGLAGFPTLSTLHPACAAHVQAQPLAPLGGVRSVNRDQPGPI